MKVFVGTAEIAGMMHFLSEAFKADGHEVTTCVDNAGTGFFDFEYDICLSHPNLQNSSKNRFVRKVRSVFDNYRAAIERKRIFDQQKDGHDIYIFIWNGFLPSSLRDYRYLKSKNKKVISIFLGSDIRHVSSFVQEYKLDISTWEQWFHTTDINDQLFRLRKAELYSDAIFSIPDQSGLAIRPYHKMYIPFDLSGFEANIPGRSIPKIVHIPSRSGIKGTAFILEAMNDLRAEGLQFEFSYVSGISNKEVHLLLRDADILVDELYLNGPGTLSLEGIASGCVVATRTLPGEAYDGIVCRVDFENFKDRLRKLITDVEFRIQLASAGNEKISFLNSPRRIAQGIIDKAFFEANSTGFDYYPSFYAEKYRLPLGTNINSQNRLLTRNIIKKYNLYNDIVFERMRGAHLV